ncbi:alpha,alpha-trehalase TreF [Paraglaciecola sp. 20A4]|uniref:alpha,alpha-trehalase TreF n=1 Tax=Paraglaciecola sp. 20A4 TaxID=2687288 RepID=UPI0014077003|nr:alpha,alpha-trehalase TreF [Paraglaciecola sp. 20A4]
MRQANSFDHESLAFFDSGLFKRIQLAGLFNDSKTLCDATPNSSWLALVALYEKDKLVDDFSLSEFVSQHFTLPEEIVLNDSDCPASLIEYIQSLWPKLTRAPDSEQSNSTLMALRHPYIIPGGRFREIYYWDSYFTALGLKLSQHTSLIESMVLNFIDLQETLGCIPNGNRSYYYSRSQPPVLAMMVELCMQKNDSIDRDFMQRSLAGMEQEYRFWMHGQDKLNGSGDACYRTVKMPCGAVLNRYWDNLSTPRSESYLEDVELASEFAMSERADFYRHIRAACESGWDFSSRWFANERTLASIQTTSIIPVDLNCLLYRLEATLGKYHNMMGQYAQGADFEALAARRKKAIDHYCWSSEQGFYFDYQFEQQQRLNVRSLAACLPLFVNIASEKQAQCVKDALIGEFLKDGGLVTTLNTSGQQWDSPNGWAPLQWFAVVGLRNYGYVQDGNDIMQRWLKTVGEHFTSSGNIMEKYNVQMPDSLADGGEYAVQQGFGWTNGVTLAFCDLLAQ